MKHCSILCAFILMVSITSAQVPRIISYQGMQTDASGDPVVGEHDFAFKLYADSTGGSALWEETQAVELDSAGIFDVLLGTVTPFPSSLDFSVQYWLGVSMDGGAEISPRFRLTTVPYAFRALYADSAGGGSASGDVNLGGDVVGAGTTGPAPIMTVISNGAVTTPKLANDAVTTAKIADDAVTTVKIADNAVTEPKIGPMEVGGGAGTGEIDPGTVIGHGTVGLSDIADETVTGHGALNANIKEETITGFAGGFPESDITSETVTGYGDPAVGANISEATVTGHGGGFRASNIADETVTGHGLGDDANITPGSVRGSCGGEISDITPNTIHHNDICTDIISYIEGLANDGGNIDLMPRGCINIIPDDPNHRIIFDVPCSLFSGSDTFPKVVVDSLIVTGYSKHLGPEEFEKGLITGASCSVHVWGDLVVEGNSYHNGIEYFKQIMLLDTTGTMSVLIHRNGTVMIMGDLTVGGKSYHLGTEYFNRIVVRDPLERPVVIIDSAGNLTLSGDLTVNGKSYHNDTEYFKRIIIQGGPPDTIPRPTVVELDDSGNATFAGDLRVGGNSYHEGTEYFKRIVVTDSSGSTAVDIKPNGDITTYGDLRVYGDSYHDGVEYFKHVVVVDSAGSLAVALNPLGLYVYKDSYHRGTEYFNNVVITGDLTYDGPRIFRGLTVVDSAGSTTVEMDQDGNVRVGGDLTVNGNSYHDGTEYFTDIVVQGDSWHDGIEYFKHIVLEDSMGFGTTEFFGNGNVEIAGDLIVHGNSYHDGWEFFDNNIVLRDSLGEYSIIIDHNGLLAVLGELHVTGKSFHSGPEYFNKIIIKNAGESDSTVITQSADGGMSLEGNITVGGNLTVTGNSVHMGTEVFSHIIVEGLSEHFGPEYYFDTTYFRRGFVAGEREERTSCTIHGDLTIFGTLEKSAGSFLIDHPLDPYNKTLRHNFVESPENLCLYKGKIELNSEGKGVVRMPDYFVPLTKENEAIVQLTSIGHPFLTAYEWDETYSSFTVMGDPNSSVAYTVYADRDDPTMNQLRRPVEETKGDNNDFKPGELLFPSAYQQY